MNDQPITTAPHTDFEYLLLSISLCAGYLSAALLLLITTGAVVCSYFFERRLWCRYLCPIGGMNGMFAKLSMTEVRGRQGVCAGNCSTYNCYKGALRSGWRANAFVLRLYRSDKFTSLQAFFGKALIAVSDKSCWRTAFFQPMDFEPFSRILHFRRRMTIHCNIYCDV